jgi:hypothetical protein
MCISTFHTTHTVNFLLILATDLQSTTLVFKPITRIIHIHDTGLFQLFVENALKK